MPAVSRCFLPSPASSSGTPTSRRVTTSWTSAYRSYTASLALDPKQAEVSINAGSLAMKLNRHGEATQHYSHAVELDPKEPRYRLFLAQAYIEQKQFERSKKVLEEALKLDSEDHRIYAMMADVYSKADRMTEAQEQINNAIRLLGDKDKDVAIEYKRRKAKYLRMDDLPGESLQVLESLDPTTRADPAVIDEIAESYWQLGDPLKAAQVFERALPVNQREPKLWEGAAWWNYKAGRRDDAKRYLEGLRDMDPHSKILQDLEPKLLNE